MKQSLVNFQKLSEENEIFNVKSWTNPFNHLFFNFCAIVKYEWSVIFYLEMLQTYQIRIETLDKYYLKFIRIVPFTCSISSNCPSFKAIRNRVFHYEILYDC